MKNKTVKFNRELVAKAYAECSDAKILQTLLDHFNMWKGEVEVSVIEELYNSKAVCKRWKDIIMEEYGDLFTPTAFVNKFDENMEVRQKLESLNGDLFGYFGVIQILKGVADYNYILKPYKGKGFYIPTGYELILFDIPKSEGQAFTIIKK